MSRSAYEFAFLFVVAASSPASWSSAGAIGVPFHAETCEGRTESSTRRIVALPVWLGDQIGVPADVVSGAREHMVTIFHNIGVDVVWDKDPRVVPRPVVALIVPDARAKALRIVDDSALGVTLSDKQPGGLIYVFYGRVARGASAKHIETSFMLGSVLAHEIAHVILGRAAHAGSGMMRPSWNEEEFHLMRGGLLLFATEEGRAIRRELCLAASAAGEYTAARDQHR